MYISYVYYRRCCFLGSKYGLNLYNNNIIEENSKEKREKNDDSIFSFYTIRNKTSTNISHLTYRCKFYIYI